MRKNQSIETPFPLLELPPELLFVEIFRHLDLTQFLILRLASKSFNEVIRKKLFKQFQYKLHAAIIFNLPDEFERHLNAENINKKTCYKWQPPGRTDYIRHKWQPPGRTDYIRHKWQPPRRTGYTGPMPGRKGATPLHLAAALGRLNFLNTLIKAGVVVAAQDKDQKSVLHYAAENGNVECAEALLKKGALAYRDRGGTELSNSAEANPTRELIHFVYELDDCFHHHHTSALFSAPRRAARADRLIEITTSEEATGEYREIFIKAVNILLNREGKLALNDEQKTFLLTSVSKLAFSTDEIPALAELAELEAAPPSGGVFSFKG